MWIWEGGRVSNSFISLTYFLNVDFLDRRLDMGGGHAPALCSVLNHCTGVPGRGWPWSTSLNGEHTKPSWHHTQSKWFTFMNINILLFKYLKISIHRWKWMRTDLDLIHQMNVAQWVSGEGRGSDIWPSGTPGSQSSTAHSIHSFPLTTLT